MKCSVIGVVVLSLFVGVALANDARLYRYKDASGSMVIRDHIPPEFVRQGYDVLNRKGMLIERVPRTLTQEELDAKYGSAEERKRAEELRRAREEADKRLLTLYSHPDDAVRARDRRLEALNVLIGVHRGNIVKLRADFDQAQFKAASLERGGKQVPSELIEKMDSLARQIERLEADIKSKESEKVEIRASYAEDIERLEDLLGKSVSEN